jgi:hypothetical protein
MPRPVEDLVGRQFGRLVVESFAFVDSHGSAHWSCRCMAEGNQTTVKADSLKSGATQSCGCRRRGGQRQPRGASSIEIAVAALTYRIERLERATTNESPDYD